MHSPFLLFKDLPDLFAAKSFRESRLGAFERAGDTGLVSDVSRECSLQIVISAPLKLPDVKREIVYGVR